MRLKTAVVGRKGFNCAVPGSRFYGSRRQRLHRRNPDHRLDRDHRNHPIQFGSRLSGAWTIPNGAWSDWRDGVRPSPDTRIAATQDRNPIDSNYFSAPKIHRLETGLGTRFRSARNKLPHWERPRRYCCVAAALPRDSCIRSDSLSASDRWPSAPCDRTS
jgi:hypothetical protein